MYVYTKAMHYDQSFSILSSLEIIQIPKIINEKQDSI